MSTHKGTSIPPFTPEAGYQRYIRKYCTVNTQTHSRTKNFATPEHINTCIQFKEKRQTEIVQLGENWREETRPCMTYSDRKHIFPTMLKQTRFCVGTGRSPLPLRQSVVPLFSECYYGFNHVVARCVI